MDPATDSPGATDEGGQADAEQASEPAEQQGTQTPSNVGTVAWRHQPFVAKAAARASAFEEAGEPAKAAARAAAAARQLLGRGTKKPARSGDCSESSDGAVGAGDASCALSAAECFRRCGVRNAYRLCVCVREQVSYQATLPRALNELAAARYAGLSRDE